ncbi:helix-turn-helix domain-containing protein [Tellurirhabdus bombi]|uniref:helix-turn-helix domain-containing protein n=1 Tax=Tellurirhabdus bombi TaxID=2907205 RepID=UPI001F353105|nr:helix-turn-helix transcriptional regulator [Tellurirhabdus bombi]
MNIGAQIRQLRQQKGYSQENMADILGISTTAYGDIERGKTDLTLSRLQQISIALGTNMQELLGEALPQPQELYPGLFHQLETLQLEREKQEIELEKLRLEVAHWKRKAEEMALWSAIRSQERERIGFK